MIRSEQDTGCCHACFARQPGAGNAINLDVFSCNPFHDLPSRPLIKSVRLIHANFAAQLPLLLNCRKKLSPFRDV
jgi:hypothetical protein